jgi:hypothetical protein
MLFRSSLLDHGVSSDVSTIIFELYTQHNATLITHMEATGSKLLLQRLFLELLTL